MYLQEAASKMYGYQEASRMYLYEAISFVQEGLLGPLYRSVTWLLNEILGSFIPYVGIEHNYPLMRIYELPPWEPDCSMLMDWALVVALGCLLFYSFALTLIILEARRAPHLGKFPEDHCMDIPLHYEAAAEDSLEASGSGNFWFSVGESTSLSSEDRTEYTDDSKDENIVPLVEAEEDTEEASKYCDEHVKATEDDIHARIDELIKEYRNKTPLAPKRRPVAADFFWT